MGIPQGCVVPLLEITGRSMCTIHSPQHAWQTGTMQPRCNRAHSSIQPPFFPSLCHLPFSLLENSTGILYPWLINMILKGLIHVNITDCFIALTFLFPFPKLLLKIPAHCKNVFWFPVLPTIIQGNCFCKLSCHFLHRITFWRLSYKTTLFSELPLSEGVLQILSIYTKPRALCFFYGVKPKT